LSRSPQITIKFEKDLKAVAVIDSGSEVNLISQEVFQKLSELRSNLLTLPVQGVNLITAFGRRSKKIKLQVLLEFHVGEDLFEAVFFISPQLSNDVILGCNFLKEYKMHLHFDSETLEYVRDGTVKRHVFTITNNDSSEMEATTANTCHESTSSEINRIPAEFPELITRQIREVGRQTINNEAYEPTNTDGASVDSSKLKDEAINKHSLKDWDSRGMTEEELITVV
jgi:hypothetical protein